MKCDVLIVGGGPAGSSAAYSCAERGLDTVFIDLKPEIGVPVTCSGAIGSYLFPLLPFKFPKHLLEWEIEGLEFFMEDISFKRTGGPWKSFAVDRSSTDKWLSDRAQGAGAELFLKTEFLKLKNGDSKRALIKKDRKKIEVEYEVLIGADGPSSKVLEQLGERKEDARMGWGMVYEYEGVDLYSLSVDQMYFGDFSPGGYAHIFPLSENRANVGVGSIMGGVDIKSCFERFISAPGVREQLKGAKKVRDKSSIIPFDNLSSRWQYGNVLLAGDAASQNIKPLMEGFLPSIICGDIAGKTAARHIEKGEDLGSYRSNVNRKLGLIFGDSDKLISLLEDISDKRLETTNLLIGGITGNILSYKEAESLKDADIEVVRARLLSWSNSRSKQLFTRLYEGSAVVYLNLLGFANSKVYKL